MRGADARAVVQRRRNHQEPAQLAIVGADRRAGDHRLVRLVLRRVDREPAHPLIARHMRLINDSTYALVLVVASEVQHLSTDGLVRCQSVMLGRPCVPGRHHPLAVERDDAQARPIEDLQALGSARVHRRITQHTIADDPKHALGDDPTVDDAPRERHFGLDRHAVSLEQPPRAPHPAITIGLRQDGGDLRRVVRIGERSSAEAPGSHPSIPDYVLGRLVHEQETLAVLIVEQHRVRPIVQKLFQRTKIGSARGVRQLRHALALTARRQHVGSLSICEYTHDATSRAGRHCGP